jgi:hypothetical protein
MNVALLPCCCSQRMEINFMTFSYSTKFQDHTLSAAIVASTSEFCTSVILVLVMEKMVWHGVT